MNEPVSPHRATLARDAALARLRRLTRTLIAVSIALAGIFAGLAAASTHPRKLVRRSIGAGKTNATSPILRTTATTTTPATGDESAPLAPTPAPPVQAPVPSSAPPVVVTGGS